MSETDENITDEPDDEPRSDAITNEPSPNVYAYEAGQFAPPPKRKTLHYVLRGLGILILLCFAVGGVIALILPACANVNNAAKRAQSMNNCKMMASAVNNCAAGTGEGEIPPSYGQFPPLGNPTPQSFFVSLLPYIGQNNLYASWATMTNTPVKTYIAPADPYNPGTNGLISYGSNATVLTVGGSPTLPASFGGRTSGTIVVFERTAKSGATWSSSNSYLIDSNGSSSPEFTSAASWSNYGNKATALTSAGCIVGMGDGSARIVTQGNANAGWAWAMDPSITDGQPVGW